MSEARVAAALVRAALARGFAMIEACPDADMRSVEENEAILKALAREALVEAEALRALSGPRDELAILEAKARHAAEAARWREALRRNDLDIIAPKLAAAAASIGLALDDAPEDALLRREAARTLAAAAAENILREDGQYEEDRAILLRRIGEAPTLQHVPTIPPLPAIGRSRPSGADIRLPTETRTEPASAGAPAQTRRATPPEDGFAPMVAAAAVQSATEAQPASAATGAPASSEPTPATSRPAGAAGAPIRSRASRRSRRAEIRDRRTPSDFLDLGVSEGFQRIRDRKVSQSKKWEAGSGRQFDKTASLVAEFFGEDYEIRNITEEDCRDFLDHLQDLPFSHGKSKALRKPIRRLVEEVVEDERRRIQEIEDRARSEKWGRTRLHDEIGKAQYRRLAPSTLYRHQVYFNQMLAFYCRKAHSGYNPMADVMWSKAAVKEATLRRPGRRPWGPEGLHALFARPLFNEPLAEPDDFAFWGPLLGRYAGLTLEEAAQLRPEDIVSREGIPVLLVREGVGQTLKRATRIRTIPAHSELIRLGFVRLAERQAARGEPWLFSKLERGPDGRFSSVLTRKFHRWRHAEELYQPGRDFHSLRKDFYQGLKSGGVDYAARAVMLGHALNDVTETHYGALTPTSHPAGAGARR